MSIENYCKYITAIDELVLLQIDDILSLENTEFWLLKYSFLYKNSKQTFSCSNFKTLPCMCFNRKSDCLFIDIYDLLEQTTLLYKKNIFFADQIKRYEDIKNLSGQKQWLFENLNENNIDLPYTSQKGIYPDKIILVTNGVKFETYQHLTLKFKGEDFKSTYDFIYLYNELFFTKKILPIQYEKWKIESGYVEM